MVVKSRTTIVLVTLALVTLTAILALMAFPQLVARKGAQPSAAAVGPPIEVTSAQTSSSATSSPISSPATVPTSPLLARIEALFSKLMAGDSAAAELAQLKRDLLAADPREAIAAIADFLNSGRDVRTGQGFSIGAGGQLDQAPTLRVLLLDLLGALARETRTADAAAISRTILENKKSADEWAIALRNVAWHEPTATAFLSGKLREMLVHEPWLQSPSAGMLEAFDVAVFTRSPEMIPPLAETLRSNRVPLQRAAAIALDRLAERAPLEVMNYLNANPGTMADRPFVRADYFAKADVAQPAQRRALEIYLSRADVALAEKTKLLEAMAMPASFVSESLLTAALAEPDETARRDAITAATSDWLAKSRFPELIPQITELRRRITTP